MRLLALTCLLLAASGIRAQGNDTAPPATGPSAPIVGRVLLADGQPLADAEVTGLWNPAVLRQLAPAGKATARTDGRGYFALSVPPAVFVYLWANGPRDEKGTCLTTSLTLAAAGQRPELQATARVPAANRVAVAGLEGVADLGPFSVRIVPVAVVDHAVTEPLAADSTFVCPPLPLSNVAFELLGKGDRVLHTWRQYPHALLTRSGPTAERAVGLKLPPVQRIAMSATTPDGKPAAGVEILQVLGYLSNTTLGSRNGGYLVPLATTGEDGKAVALLPLANNPFEAGSTPSLTFVARKQGCADAQSGWSGSRFENGKMVEEENPPAELRFTMAPARPLAGKFTPTDAPERPQGFLLEWISKAARGNGWSHIPRSQFVPIDPNGSFRVDNLPLDAYALEVRAPLGGRLVTLDNQQEFPAQPIEVALPRMRPVEIQVLDRNGGPASGATAHLVSMLGNTGFAQDGTSMPFALDPNGRARIALPPGRWFVAVADADSTACVEVPIENPPAELTVPMTEMPSLRGRVVDADGNPVQGATLQQVRSRYVGGPRSEEDKLLDVLGSLTQNTSMRATSGPDGMFVMHFVERPWYRVQAKVVAGDRSSEPFEIEPGEDVLQVKLQ